jgi:hypothetical protein
MPRPRKVEGTITEKKHFSKLASMPREAPITQGPAEFDERTKLRVHILSMRLFPNLYNADFLRRGS